MIYSANLAEHAYSLDI